MVLIHKWNTGICWFC